ncbi:MATE family efflux transporter [Tropicimonas isoalkanivorans]|uniref:Multidrug export protein MepA n=1 Tax=Tropicimonas isoalkanivorans TaxID=441112 RepID=A0A1I1DN62_9RHOB|nr:MATE family efflux transporter [Tropicimonas isoalkanivorans]SFB76284.1 putative efflux protein, MATE family [Tropicimonas isoalkanivorans]
MSVGPAPETRKNQFLTRPIGRLFLSNALPMAVVLSTGGLLNVIDGIFVGRFVGAQALAAVSLAFPVVMLLTALTTLAGGGMSSLLARHLGAGSRTEAEAVFAGAHGLALAISAVLVAGALALGPATVSALAAGNSAVAGPAQSYLLILILGAPIQFGLGLHADAMRIEGRAGHIAVLSVLVNLLNIGANYVAIVLLGLGVAGSALGTVSAQTLGLVLLLLVRARDRDLLPLGALLRASWLSGWRQILSLGLPLCLNFIGMALVASMVLLVIGTTDADHAAYIAAYGVVTRVLGLAFLPQMAIALTTQSITGNNAGAGRMDRATSALRLAMGSALLWCLGVTLAGAFAGASLGALFSDDRSVVAAVAAILRPMTALYAITGPILVLALHFQAMGYPLRTAALTLVKPWVLTPALLVVLNALAGIDRLWFAFPVADGVLLVLALTMVRRGHLIAPVQGTADAKEAA